MASTEFISDGLFYFDANVRSLVSGSKRHYHNQFEIYYMKEGTCNYFIDNKTYEVVSGDVVLIPEGVIHKTNYGDEPHTRLLLNCSQDYIPTGVLSELPSMMYLYRNETTVAEIDALFSKIQEEAANPDSFTAELIRCYTNMLFYIMARGGNRFSDSGKKNSFVEAAVRHVQKNYMHQVSLSELAKAFSVTPEHLSRSFKRETGFGFNEFLTLIRLQKAETMLKNENGKSISEIAYACGFNDSNYFSDKFKRAYGIVPTELRRQYLAKSKK
jgi:AraC-like DNA-binding protein